MEGEGEGIGVSFGGGKLGDNKIKKIKYVVAFNGRQSMNLHTTTNQKQSAAMEGTKNGRCGGSTIPSFWGGIEFG